MILITNITNVLNCTNEDYKIILRYTVGRNLQPETLNLKPKTL